MSRRTLRAAFAVAGVAGSLVLSAPAAAKDAPSLPDRYTRSVSGEMATVPWWEDFGDERLQALIRRALADNGDVVAGWARVDQADALARQSLAQLLPSVSGTVSANLSPSATLGFQFGGLPSTPGQPERPPVYVTGNAALQVALEPDITGRRYLAWRASRADVAAGQGDAQSLMLALSTRVAEAYFDLASTSVRLKLLREQLRANEQLLELLELRFEQGAGTTALDVLQQRQQVAASSALLPQTRSRLVTLRQQLSVLTGQPPEEELVAVPSDLPMPPPLAATGLPAELLEHRPDVRASAARLDAAELRAGSAVRALFPSLRLTGQAGVQAITLNEFRTQPFWGAGASLSVPIWLGGAQHAAVRQARAAETAAIASFRQLVLQAAQEVEGVLAREVEQREQVAAQERQVEAARLAREESQARYLAGLTNYVQVLTATNAWQQAQLSLLQSRRDLLGLRIQLHAAVGGGWTRGLTRPGEEVTR